MKYIYLILIILSLNASGLFSQCNSCGEKTKCDRIRPASYIAQSNEADEFEEYHPEKEKSAANESSEDEFEEYDPNAAPQAAANSQTPAQESKSITEHKLFFPILSLIFTIIAGIFLRFKPTRKLRGIFLIASAVTLGFYVGACPCPISSFSYAVIAASGGEVHWDNMLWFLALIPITFVFHKVWCGWICHLGALQEFLYIPAAKMNFLRGRKAQLVMKYMRYILVLALIVQLAITHSYLYDEVDPFKTAYNLGYNAEYIEWILLGLLLLTSVFIYRPFCKAACPIGLILGWVTKIRGAAVLGDNGNCVGCSLGSQNCNTQAIYRVENYSVLDNKECIACGECMDHCRKSALEIFRKGEKHNDVVKMCKSNTNN